MKTKSIHCIVILVTALRFLYQSVAAQSKAPGSEAQNALIIPGWRDVTNTDAPAGHYWYTAVWIGTEMIVFGGVGENPYRYLNDGGRYSPISNSWASLPLAGAPSSRSKQTAVWTGTDMIVWGGRDLDQYLGNGASLRGYSAIYIPWVRK